METPPRQLERDVLPAMTPSTAAREDLCGIVTAIARASHDIADLVSLGQVAPPRRPTSGTDETGHDDHAFSARARHILRDHLNKERVKALRCAGDHEFAQIEARGVYTVTIDPLEGTADAEANLPFGTIFSIEHADDTAPQSGHAPLAAGFIHYGPQTNLVLTLGAGVCIFNLDRAARIYLLAAEGVKIPEQTRELAIDATRCSHWPAAMRGLVNQQLDESEMPGEPPVDILWTGSLTADAYRILRRGGGYIFLEDDRPGHEDRCPNLIFACRPIAYIIEQAGGRASTGYERLLDKRIKGTRERAPFVFGSRAFVERVERLQALPEGSFDNSPLFRTRGLFQL